MALFGKKKKAEQTAPQPREQDEIQVVGGDADELDMEDDGGQVIDFDAIADELEGDDGQSMMGQPLGNGNATAATPFDDDAFGNDAFDNDAFAAPNQSAATDDFAPTAGFESGSAGLDADDGLDFDSVFDDGSPSAGSPTAGAPSAGASAALPETDENPFGAEPMDAATFSDAPTSGSIAIEPTSDTPPLTHTAPLLTSDAVATAGVPATRKSFPLPLLLGAIGLLIALGTVGYLVTQGNSESEEPVVAVNPGLRAPKTGAAAIELANQRAVVDGVPIAPGAVGLTAPGLVGPKPTVPLTPALQKQLKALWKQGAAAKKKGDIAGARAAWTEMLRRRPNHPFVQSAIDQLPAA